MNRRVRQLFCLSLLLWSLTLPAAADEGFYGVWSGRVTEIQMAKNVLSSYTVTIQIFPGRATVDYPALGCRGILLLRRRGERYLDFQDKLDDSKRCESRGHTELLLLSADLVAYLWFDAQGQLKAGGYLQRQQQLAVLTTPERYTVNGTPEIQQQRKIEW